MPEGVPKQYNTPILLNLNNGAKAHATVHVSLPQTVVARSERVRISVIGEYNQYYNTVKPAHVVISIQQSPVLTGYLLF
jgi:hypothetical protein